MEYKVIVVAVICGMTIDFESGWWPDKSKAEAEAYGIAESKLPAGIYQFGTITKERTV